MKKHSRCNWRDSTPIYVSRWEPTCKEILRKPSPWPSELKFIEVAMVEREKSTLLKNFKRRKKVCKSDVGSAFGRDALGQCNLATTIEEGERPQEQG